MFEMEEWAANKQADELTVKLFATSRKRKRKHEDTEKKKVKLQKLNMESRKRYHVHDGIEKRTKKVKLGVNSPLREDDTKLPKERKSTKFGGKVDKSPRKVKSKTDSNTPIVSKSPRNKYKHLAVKKGTLDKEIHRQNKLLTDKMTNNTQEKVVSYKKTNNISDSEGARDERPDSSGTVTPNSRKLKRRNSKKGRKEMDHIVSDEQSKPQTEQKDLKRKRKRKKKNDPKKNKYRHLVLAKLANSSNKDIISSSLSENISSDGERNPTDRKLSHGVSTGETHKKMNKTFEDCPIDQNLLKNKLAGIELTSDKTNMNVSSSTPSKSKSKKMMKNEGKVTGKVASETISCKPEEDVLKKSVKTSKKSVEKMSLREKMTVQLKGARFRYLNEQLYTQTGTEAYKLLHGDEEAFKVYHEGFQSQVEKWPSSPLDIIIKYVKTRPSSLIVADFGCGDAKLARVITNIVYSFDLVALNDHVTPCNMSKVPLSAESVDICVFCLSLMGTNLSDYLCEANRVLKMGGIMKIAEVVSRIKSLPTFIGHLEEHGFKNLHKDTTNKMFVMVDFKKVSLPKKMLPEISLDPCYYKRR